MTLVCRRDFPSIDDDAVGVVVVNVLPVLATKASFDLVKESELLLVGLLVGLMVVAACKNTGEPAPEPN